jgi:hypothetical protein
MLSSRPSTRIQPLYVTFLVHSWSNNCYSGFQIAVLVTIRAAYFQAVANRNCAVTAAVSNRFCESVPTNAHVFTDMVSLGRRVGFPYIWLPKLFHDCERTQRLHRPLHLLKSLQSRYIARWRLYVSADPATTVQTWRFMGLSFRLSQTSVLG